MKNTEKPDPAVDKPADAPRTPGENLKHAARTSLPPGVNAEDADDPGTSLGGKGGRDETLRKDQ